MYHQQHPPITDFVVIEFPGVVRSLDKALETMGGLDSISTVSAYFDKKMLRLRLCPSNVYHAGMQAERRDCSSMFSGQMQLVVKVIRKKSAPKEVSATCLGLVSTVFSFRSINDFQYLPIVPSSTPNIQKEIVSELIPTDFSSALNWWNQEWSTFKEIPSFLPPFTFTRYNNASKFLLHVSESQNQNSSHTRTLRLERKAFTVTANGNDEFPMSPSQSAISDVNSRIKTKETHKLIENLFKERPMWTRTAIVYKTKLHDNLLKIMLAKYAFYILSGPWGRLWCRFGYDPRSDQNSREYQTVVVSFKKRQYIPERNRVKVNKINTSLSTSNSNKEEFYDYIYRPGCLPQMRQMWYSLCDVHLPSAQRLCRKDFMIILKLVDESNGWFTSDKIEAVREAIKQDVIATVKKFHTEKEIEMDSIIDDDDDDEFDDTESVIFE